MRALGLGALAVLLLAAWLLAACWGSPAGLPAAAPPAQDDEMSQHHAFKGMELYSWSTREGGKDVFHYALAFGTNRRKSREEIQARPLTLAQVKEEIAKLPPGESLAWSNEVVAPGTAELVTLPLPPAETIEEILRVARARRIDLWVDGYTPSGELQP